MPNFVPFAIIFTCLLALTARADDLSYPVISGSSNLSIGVIDDVPAGNVSPVLELVNHDVLSEQAIPEACMLFNGLFLPTSLENLVPYFAIDSQTGHGLSIRDGQVCIDQLVHGQVYPLQIKAGLTSADGRMLKKAVSLVLQVPNRAPDVQFMEQGHIIPAKMSGGLPIQTMNVDSVRLWVYHVNPRNIIDQLRTGLFGQDLNEEQLAEFTRDHATLQWSGTVPIAAQINEAVVTSLPLDDFGKGRSFGLHLVVAEPPHGLLGEGSVLPSQWFVRTDIGMTVLRNPTSLSITTYNLSDGRSSGFVDLDIVSRSNAILMSQQSDENGFASFSFDEAGFEGANAPLALVATTEQGDLAFINLDDDPLDLTGLGDGGLDVDNAIRAFMMPDRQDYMSGDTANITYLIRDRSMVSLDGLESLLTVTRPDGVVVHDEIIHSDKTGGGVFSYHLGQQIMPGNWQIAMSDPTGAIQLGETAFNVRQVSGGDMDVTLQPLLERWPTKGFLPVSFAISYGGMLPASGLNARLSVDIEPASWLKDEWSEFYFGYDEEGFSAYRDQEIDITLDEQGFWQGDLILQIPVDVNIPLEARLTVTDSGDANRPFRTERRVVLDQGRFAIGIQPVFPSHIVPAGSTAQFDIVGLAPAGHAVPVQRLEWELVQEMHDPFMLASADQGPISRPGQIIDQGAIGLRGPTRLTVDVDQGLYRLIVRHGADNVVATYRFTAGVGGSGGAGLVYHMPVTTERDANDVSLVKISVEPPFPGQLTTIIADREILSRSLREVSSEPVTLEFTDSGVAATDTYALLILREALDQVGDGLARQAMGLVWLGDSVSPPQINLSTNIPDNVLASTDMESTITLEGLLPGDTGQAVIVLQELDSRTMTTGAVSALDWSVGQKRFPMALHHIFGGLPQVEPEDLLKSGADLDVYFDDEDQMSGSMDRDEPFRSFYGPMAFNDAQPLIQNLEWPDRAGEYEITILAWTGDKIGVHQQVIQVEAPLLVDLSAPKALRVGDELLVNLSLTNALAMAGDYTLKLSSSRDRIAFGEFAGFVAKMGPGESREVQQTIMAASRGEDDIILEVTGPGGVVLERRWPIMIGEVDSATMQVVEAELAPGQTSVFGPMMAGLPEGSQVAFDVALSATPDLAMGLLQARLWRSDDQTIVDVVSQGFSDLMASDGTSSVRVIETVTELAQRQLPEGGFVQFASDASADLALSAFVGEFWIRASNRGYAIPDEPMQRLMMYLESEIRVALSDPSDDVGMAYAIQVLARSNRANANAVLHAAELYATHPVGPVAKAYLASAMAHSGDVAAARDHFSQIDPVAAHLTLGDMTAIAVLFIESGFLDPAGMLTLSAHLADSLAVTPYPTNEALARLLIFSAVQADQTQADVRASINDAIMIEDLSHWHREVVFGDQLAEISVVNNGQLPVYQSIGWYDPLASSSIGDGSISLRREITNRSIDAMSLDNLRPGQSLMAVVDIQVHDPDIHEIRLLDPLSAGLFLESRPIYLDHDGIQLREEVIIHDQFADVASDRGLETAVLVPESRRMRIHYHLRAGFPGFYHLPPLTVVDRYDQEKFARTSADQILVRNLQ